MDQARNFPFTEKPVIGLAVDERIGQSDSELSTIVEFGNSIVTIYLNNVCRYKEKVDRQVFVAGQHTGSTVENLTFDKLLDLHSVSGYRT